MDLLRSLSAFQVPLISERFRKGNIMPRFRGYFCEYLTVQIPHHHVDCLKSVVIFFTYYGCIFSSIVEEILSTSNLDYFTSSFLDRRQCRHTIKIVSHSTILTSILHVYEPCVVNQLKCIRSKKNRIKLFYLIFLMEITR